MAGRLGHIPGPNNHDTRRYFPRRNPSFAGYEQIPRILPPPSYELPTSVHYRYIAAQGRLWEVTSPNSLQNAFCPGKRPSNLNLHVNHLEEYYRRYDGHMGPFDPSVNAQFNFPDKPWRPLIIAPAAGQPRDSPEYESVLNCWKSNEHPAFDTGIVHNSYIDRLIRKNQEVEKRMEALHKVYSDRFSMEPSHRALWSSTIRPTLPSSEHLDSLRRIKRFPTAVDLITESQRGIKDKRAFVDYVSRLQASPFWMPDPNAPVEMADDRYLGVWLNGTEERLARWYLKEGIPCFVVREITFPERARLAAPETVIDFAAGSSASALHWSINEYDAMALTRGDMALPNPSFFHNPGWIWSDLMDKIRSTTTVEPEEPQEINYEPSPLDTVTISPDRVPWIRPPPVIRAEPSRPGAPPHERKRWVKYLERPNAEGTLQEVGTKHNFDYYTYSMYDREKRWHIHFLRRPKLPEGCVSNPEVFGQPCPAGTYLNFGGKRRQRPRWIYHSKEPKAMDVGKKAPTPKPEDLPLLGRPPPSAPDDDDDSDGDQYPEYRGYVPPKSSSTIDPHEPDKSAIAEPAAPVQASEPTTSTLDESGKSATAEPAAQTSISEPAASGANTRTESSPMEAVDSLFVPPLPTTNLTRSEDEVSLGEDPEPMGPQIAVPATDLDVRMSDEIAEDPLEFASSHLMLYGIPTSEDFSTVQTLVNTIASRLDLTVKHLFRVTADRSHSFWFEMASVGQARQMRTYMHHRLENNLELLVSYANYEDYVRALARSTHQWPNAIEVDRRQVTQPSAPVPPITGTSTRRQDDRERRPYRETRRRSPSEDRHRFGRRSPPSYRRSPSRSTYSRRYYHRSPSPHYRDRPSYRRSRSPAHRPLDSSRESSSRASVPRERSPLRPIASMNPEPLPVPPLPAFPSIPVGLGLPPNTPLPYGANIAFMWSPSGNTLSPVLLQGNTTVIPYPLPSTVPTPSALLPWPVAAALTTPPIPTATRTSDDSLPSLVSRMTTPAETQPASPSRARSSPSLMSRMTDSLSIRLSDPNSSLTLSDRLSDPNRPTLADRLGMEDYMEIDQPSEAPSMGFNIPGNQLTRSMPDANAPYQHPGMRDSTPAHDSQEEETMDDIEEGELGYKKTKRGRRSGHKIQGYRRRDEEREERRRRRQGRR